MTALSKMSGQEIPGLCLLTFFSMGGMMGGFREHAPRKGFHIAVMVMYIYQWHFIHPYKSTCIDILEERGKRFMSVSKIGMIGPQREMISQIGIQMDGKISWNETLPSSD